MSVAAKPDFFSSQYWQYERERQKAVAFYEQKGFDVEFIPSQSKLPEFLRGFYPDFVATRASDHVAVEIETVVKVRPASYWHRFVETVKQHRSDGWRIDYRHASGEVEAWAHLTLEDAERQLVQAKELQNDGFLPQALLLTWDALELVMRWAVDANQVEVPDYTPARLISSLYADGVLARDEYDLLVKYLSIRYENSLEISGQSTLEDLQALWGLARRLSKPPSEDGE